MLSPTHYEILEKFMSESRFLEKGIIELDLDGTTLDENEEGKVFISGAVERAIKRVIDLGCPVVLNTLRFPLSVMSAIGREWHDMTKAEIPVVLLNGSVVGRIYQGLLGLEFEETMTFPLLDAEIEEIVKGIRELLAENIHDFIFFYYPQNWRIGEVIWTPDEGNIENLKRKWRSASNVITSGVDELEKTLMSLKPCLASILIDRPKDKLMLYQHSKPSEFFTREGVNKSFGMRLFAEKLGVSLKDSIGAGDTAMDTFLDDVGLAVLVGPRELPFSGQKGTVRIKNPQELAALIDTAVDLTHRKL